MADVYTKAKRSEVMARIKGSNNRSTELRLIEIMKAVHVTGWLRHQPLPGHPDFVFRPERVAVFVDGCFWHCCPKCSTRPKSNAAFWEKKLEANRRRDREVVRQLRANGWKTLRLWEHELHRGEAVVRKLQRALGRVEERHA